MDVSPFTAEGVYLIKGYGPGFIQVNQDRHDCSLIVGPGVLQTWALEPDATLDRAALEPIVEMAPEMVLIGTGSAIRHLDPQVRQWLREVGIRVELVDTPNACRTYNFLVQEGRSFLAALVVLP